MNITLNQKDIQKALLLYIIGQGINMEGKTLDVTFTSGRKDNGLTAALHISETVIPGFTDSSDTEVCAAQKVNTQTAVAIAPSVPVDNTPPDLPVQAEVAAVTTEPAAPAVTLTAHDAALVASLADTASTVTSLFATGATEAPVETAVPVDTEVQASAEVKSLFAGQ